MHSRPSLPSEPSLRRLGVGGSGGGGDRPLRAQLIVALVVGLVLLAVPLYLWRRPSGTENAPKDAGGAGDAGTAASDAEAPAPGSPDAGQTNERVKVGNVLRVKCGASARGGQEGSLCDRLPFFEEQLTRAIRDNVDCAPKAAKDGSINFVLTVDFRARKVHVFPGQSGSWRGPAARKAAACVKRALSAPDWAGLSHQHKYYSLAVLATYAAPPAAAAPAPSGTAPLPPSDGGPPPLFE
ncbi:MAG: hypothetical protein HYZ29_18370 [Myxococcales bacterium]|nr:hypothetical protein [Myxococcales bacterium]